MHASAHSVRFNRLDVFSSFLPILKSSSRIVRWDWCRDTMLLEETVLVVSRPIICRVSWYLLYWHFSF